MTQQEIDEMYMRRCLQLAANGLGRVRPNPLVGCVVVSATEGSKSAQQGVVVSATEGSKSAQQGVVVSATEGSKSAQQGVVNNGHIISEGFHQKYGHNHAERNALLRLDSSLITHHSSLITQHSSLYVNLEPCSHYGKTPPCADLIVEKGIRRVVCCNDDPNPLVAGNGFRKLEAAGIEVVRHVLEEEGRKLNRRFFTFMEQHRPYVILKWAESADGFMAPGTSGTYWLSTQAQNRLNHRWRTEEAAILVGSETYLKDSPTLTARHFLGPQPQPVVLDRRGRLTDVPSHWLHLRCQTIPEVLQALYEHKLQSVIVEGGRRILDAFVASGLYDEVRILRSPQTLGSGLRAPEIPPVAPDRLTIIEP